MVGNESCDLDSCISCLAFAYHLHLATKVSNAIVLPVQNVSSENFRLRTDNCFVLEEAGVPVNLLFYRYSPDLGTIKNHYYLTFMFELRGKYMTRHKANVIFL